MMKDGGNRVVGFVAHEKQGIRRPALFGDLQMMKIFGKDSLELRYFFNWEKLPTCIRSFPD